jgi:hypothetical protein
MKETETRQYAWVVVSEAEGRYGVQLKWLSMFDEFGSRGLICGNPKDNIARQTPKMLQYM